MQCLRRLASARLGVVVWQWSTLDGRGLELLIWMGSSALTNLSLHHHDVGPLIVMIWRSFCLFKALKGSLSVVQPQMEEGCESMDGLTETEK